MSLDWDYEITELRARLDHGERLVRKGAVRRTRRENDLFTDYFIRYPGPDHRNNPAVADKLKELQKKLTELKERTPALTQAYILKRAEEPRTTHIALKGDYRAPGMEVQPDTPGFLPSIARTDEPPRLQLAKWLVSSQNPLTARVAVNRMWQELMGRGIVGTSNDFGVQGQLPTHPELLDWLASEFIAQGWSTKAMHKLIVTSATFRQSSQARPDLSETDPDNRLFARQNRLRLPAENLRDAALAVSGLLSSDTGGPASVRLSRRAFPSSLTDVATAGWRAQESSATGEGSTFTISGRLHIRSL